MDDAPHPIWIVLGAGVSGVSALGLFLTDLSRPWLWYGVVLGAVWVVLTIRGGLR